MARAGWSGRPPNPGGGETGPGGKARFNSHSSRGDHQSIGKEHVLRRVRSTFKQLTALGPVVGCSAMVLTLGFSSGCNNFFDPSEVSGRNNPAPMRQQILDTLPMRVVEDIDPALEQTNPEFADAVEPAPEDMQTRVEDYVLSPNDVITISISDLQGQGVETVVQKRISNTGRITLPYIGVIPAAGRSEVDFEQAIVEAYRAGGVIQNAQVSVIAIEARGRTYNITGSVNRPGQYTIYDNNFRLLDAMTLAGDAQSPFVDTIYVIRGNRQTAGSTGGAGGGAGGQGTTQPATPPADNTPAPDDLAPPEPQSKGLTPASARPVYLNAAPPADDLAPAGEGAAGEAAPAAGGGRPDPIAQPPGAVGEPGERIGNIDGEEVPVTETEGEAPAPVVTDPAATDPGAGVGAQGEAGTGGSFGGFNDIADRDLRVIRIPYDELRNQGQIAKYNIAIRPGDTILVQPPLLGTYYMGGHVLAPGAYSLAGQKVTLTQAIISARMLDTLAIPERTDLVRKVGPNEQILIRVNLARIFAGTEPDLYIKPDDQVRVGTSWYAPFFAAARGAFRFTYGFGFIYDRNFAYDQDDRFR